MIRIPGDNGWFQNNRGDTLGTISDSFNLDLASNQGRVRLTRSKRLAYTGSPTNFGEVAALEYFEGDFVVASENASGHDIWVGANSPFDTLTNDTSSVEIVPSRTDMKAWNSGLYVTNSTEIKYTTDGTTYSEVGSDVLTGNGGLLAAKNDILYVSDEHYKVKSVTSANAFQSSGTNTLNLGLTGHHIHFLDAGLDSVWVGLSNRDGSGKSLVFEWDGVTANAPSTRFELDATAIMAGVIKDGVPYILDSFGRLLVLQGQIFVEVARFPLNGRSFSGFNDDTNNGRAVHPRGMAVDGDEILINVANRTEEVTSETFNEFPSGVWAYSEAHGLQHKFSPSYQAKADTGTTNMTDHGQIRCHAAGPMMVVESIKSDDAGTDNAGRVVFSLQYYTDADDTSSDTEWGLFADDTNDNTQKAGWLVTPRIPSAVFRDTWQKIYAAFSDLETTGDIVEVKYRVKDETPTYVTATWASTTRFGTPTNLSSYEEGDEVTIVQGKGAGAVAHIASIETGANSGVTLDRAITGVTGTCKARLDKWIKVGKIEDIAHEGFDVGADGHWIQIKVYMQWTGKRELYDILVTNKSSL